MYTQASYASAIGFLFLPSCKPCQFIDTRESNVKLSYLFKQSRGQTIKIDSLCLTGTIKIHPFSYYFLLLSSRPKKGMRCKL